MSEFKELRKWLEGNGFKFAENPIRHHANECNWYAYRQSRFDARRCECNDDKPRMQILVNPSSIKLHGVIHESVEVELCGEFDGVWWRMKAYSLKPSEVATKLYGIEFSLISAWDALSSNKQINPRMC